MMPKRAAIYVRVSTSDQHLEPQLDPLRAHAAARGWAVQEFRDHGVSGAKDRRPALDELMRAVRRREVDVVVVAKLDRLARSVRHLVELAGEFDALGVGLVVLDQAIDTTTPAGRFLFHSLAAVAELERDLIRERVVAGMRAAKRRGAAIGRPKALDANRADLVRRRRAAGASLSMLASEFGVGRATVVRALSRG
jgi:DNA invertase Pin-like site-specific DNA recombinase